MECPVFSVGAYGVFESSAAGRRDAMSKERCVARYEIELYTSDGTGATFLDGKEHPLKRGMLLCAKPGQLRYSRLPLRCHYVHLRTEDAALRQLLDALPNACVLSDMGPVARVFQDLVQLPEPEGPEDRLMLQSLVAKLIYVVLRRTEAEKRTGAAVSRSSRAVLMETDEYIRTNLSRPLTLEDLAERANFSPAHFHRIFAACFGKTPHEYVLNCRIEAAKAALRADSCTLLDLASACGFSSQSYFSYQFKRTVGMTPTQYRRRMLTRLEE